MPRMLLVQKALSLENLASLLSKHPLPGFQTSGLLLRTSSSSTPDVGSPSAQQPLKRVFLWIWWTVFTHTGIKNFKGQARLAQASKTTRLSHPCLRIKQMSCLTREPSSAPPSKSSKISRPACQCESTALSLPLPLRGFRILVSPL